MIRNGNCTWAAAIPAVTFLLASAGQAASMVEVPRATWAGNVNLPSYVKMYVYVPDKLASKPPLVVSNHSCGSTASGQMGNTPKLKALADKNGFIMILPDNPGQNCWDVGTKASLTHDGNGDTHAIAQMVRYALSKYKADSSRVYVVGGSSGGMMTQALLGVYPELFVAGAPRAGVPCGCWAESYASSNQWSGPCAGGTVTKTAQVWGDYVRAINPNYTGHRPRVQIFHGESDETILYNNFKEGVKQWTNVLGLPTASTSTGSINSSAGYAYNRQLWKNSCGYTVLEAWSAPGQKHSMKYEEDSIIKFFGLNIVDGKDPELAACPTGVEFRTTGVHTPLSFKERTFFLAGIPAGEVQVRIVNTAGQVEYSGRHLVGSSASSISIPLPSLKRGYYFASATAIATERATERHSLNFALVD